jgi:hypothetical protein
MGQFMIVAIACIGILWNIDPALRPILDVVIWLIAVGVMLALGARCDNWLRRLAQRPRR